MSKEENEESHDDDVCEMEELGGKLHKIIHVNNGTELLCLFSKPSDSNELLSRKL